MANNIATNTWSQVASRQSTILLLPLGSCEQHGPHLPLDTDTQIAQHLCAQAAQQDNRILIAPSLSITASGEHAGFPGTLSIGTDALTQVLIEIVRSADWCNGVVFVNGHGGNTDAVNAAVRTLKSEQRNVAAWWPRIEHGDAHAGASETSMMLAIHPSRSIWQRLRRDQPNQSARFLRSCVAAEYVRCQPTACWATQLLRRLSTVTTCSRN